MTSSSSAFQSVLQFAATMRQRESWRKVRRDNAIRAEKKRSKVFPQQLKVVQSIFSVGEESSCPHYGVM